jgi:copper(I)-binding protein
MRNLLFVSLLMVGACAPEGAPQIEIEEAWARPTIAAGHSSAAYMTIRNPGSGADKLISVTTDVAGHVGLHRSANEDGIAIMRPIDGGLEIKAGQGAQLEPGGNHLMLERVVRPLAPGQRIRLVLRFERSGERSIDVPVREGAPNSAHAGH